MLSVDKCKFDTWVWAVTVIWDYLKITNHYLYEWNQVHKYTLTKTVADIFHLILTSISAKCLSQGSQYCILIHFLPLKTSAKTAQSQRREKLQEKAILSAT